MSWQESVLRKAGFVVAGSLVIDPPVWIFAGTLPLHWLKVVLLCVGWTAVGTLIAGYGVWLIGGSNDTCASLHLGSHVRRDGRGRGPIFWPYPYLLYGPRFKQRIRQRRLYALEVANGWDHASPFTEDFIERPGAWRR